MTDILGRFTGRFRAAEQARPSNPYLPLLAQSLAAANARFHTWEFEPETRTLDPETATAEQLRRAISDCDRCTAVEYPETEGGTYYALKREQALSEVLNRRFPKQARAILAEVHAEAMRASRIAHP